MTRSTLLFFVILVLASVVCAQINFSPGWGKRSTRHLTAMNTGGKLSKKEILLLPMDEANGYAEQASVSNAPTQNFECKLILKSLHAIKVIIQVPKSKLDRFVRYD